MPNRSAASMKALALALFVGLSTAHADPVAGNLPAGSAPDRAAAAAPQPSDGPVHGVHLDLPRTSRPTAGIGAGLTSFIGESPTSGPCDLLVYVVEVAQIDLSYMMPPAVQIGDFCH